MFRMSRLVTLRPETGTFFAGTAVGYTDYPIFAEDAVTA